MILHFHYLVIFFNYFFFSLFILSILYFALIYGAPFFYEPKGVASIRQWTRCCRLGSFMW